MKINKGLKKEKNNLKMFYIIMIGLLVILPIVTDLSGTRNPFIWMYLLALIILILLSILIKTNYYMLKYRCSNNKLKFRSGVFSKESLILCDKVCIVDTDKSKEEMSIILVTNIKFKNKNLKPVTKGFLKKYPNVENEYNKLRKLEDASLYYYQIIKRGGLHKYDILNCIYGNCVKAIYTDSAIENIKIARGQIDL